MDNNDQVLSVFLLHLPIGRHIVEVRDFNKQFREYVIRNEEDTIRLKFLLSKKEDV